MNVINAGSSSYLTVMEKDFTRLCFYLFFVYTRTHYHSINHSYVCNDVRKGIVIFERFLGVVLSCAASRIMMCVCVCV